MQILEGGVKPNRPNVVIDVKKDSEESQRLVVGFATLNNVDLADDVVTTEASMKAFGKFRGNVRFMHDKQPVGTVVEYAPGTYYDEKTQKEYEGVRVAVRVSEAAEKAWQMCLDGTLSGFSIGGSIKKVSTEWNEAKQKNVQIIQDYELTELSLVDSPANNLANLQTIYKSVDGVAEEVPSGLNLFAGFEKVFEIDTEGDPEMADENKTETLETVDEVEANETEAPEVTDEVEVDETETEEVEKVDAPSLEEQFEKLSNQIRSQGEEIAKTVDESVASKIADFKKEFDNRFTELAEAQKSFDEPLSDLRSRLNKLEESVAVTQKSLDSIVENSAMSKSLDSVELSKSLDQVEKPEEVFDGLFSARYETILED